jgi:hypothetical protein
LFEYTPVLCEYSPVRIVERLGQHSGFTTKAFGKSIPLATSWLCTIGICPSSSQRWSSVRIRIRFVRDVTARVTVRLGVAFGCSELPVQAAARNANAHAAAGRRRGHLRPLFRR